MNHYDVRGPYSAEIGRELAKQYDLNVARMAVLATRQFIHFGPRSRPSRPA